MAEILRDQRDYHAPALVICSERFRPSGERDSVETGLGDGEHDAVRHFCQGECDKSGRLSGIVDAGLYGVGMPSKREQPAGFHLFDHDLDRLAFIGLLGLGYLGIDCGGYDDSADDGAWLNGLSNFMPNQVPNSVESDRARQTRCSGGADHCSKCLLYTTYFPSAVHEGPWMDPGLLSTYVPSAC